MWDFSAGLAAALGCAHFTGSLGCLEPELPRVSHWRICSCCRVWALRWSSGCAQKTAWGQGGATWGVPGGWVSPGTKLEAAGPCLGAGLWWGLVASSLCMLLSGGHPAVLAAARCSC